MRATLVEPRVRLLGALPSRRVLNAHSAYNLALSLGALLARHTQTGPLQALPMRGRGRMRRGESRSVLSQTIDFVENNG